MWRNDQRSDTEEPQDKVLIINADDYGDDRFNPSIEAGFNSGFITSATMLVGRSGARGAAVRSRQNGYSVGLHLNLTIGPPVANPLDIPTLVGSNGEYLGPDVLRAALQEGEIDPDDIHRECDAQLALHRELFGGTTLHVDGHHHIHVEPEVATVVAPLLAEYGIERIRMPIEDEEHFAHIAPERFAWARRVMESARESQRIFAAYGCRWPSFVGMGYGWEECTLERLDQRFRNLPSGVSEYMVHVVRPGDVPPDDLAFRRYHEWKVLASGEFRDLLKRHSLTLATFAAA